ncbi:hypothetical protein TWF506_009108 [Arthrobotrys conoides]|uniref:Uncharacterized protein n=1 Tax=Arthrobotrys conoides TaxID=74498 RepID=A0AAN8N443_9PEZI
MLRSLFSITRRAINSALLTVKGAATRISEILVTDVIFRTTMRALTDFNGARLPEARPSKWCNCTECMDHPRAKQHLLERKTAARKD